MNLMDTVGMSQLDAPDHEAYFQSTAYEPGEVDTFLRNTSVYVVKQGLIIRDGDTADGPGNVRWQGFNVSEGRVRRRAGSSAGFRWTDEKYRPS